MEYPNFPTKLLPQVKKPGYEIAARCRLPGSSTVLDVCKIFTPLGDLQCSVYPCFEKDTDCGIKVIKKKEFI